MDRRGFLLGLTGLVGAGATAGLALTPAKATPLTQLKDLKDLEPLDEMPQAEDTIATAPDGTPIEQVARRVRVRVCRTVRDRWGNRRRRCWYEWRWVR